MRPACVRDAKIQNDNCLSRFVEPWHCIYTIQFFAASVPFAFRPIFRSFAPNFDVHIISPRFLGLFLSSRRVEWAIKVENLSTNSWRCRVKHPFLGGNLGKRWLPSQTTRLTTEGSASRPHSDDSYRVPQPACCCSPRASSYSMIDGCAAQLIVGIARVSQQKFASHPDETPCLMSSNDTAISVSFSQWRCWRQ